MRQMRLAGVGRLLSVSMLLILLECADARKEGNYDNKGQCAYGAFLWTDQRLPCRGPLCQQGTWPRGERCYTPCCM
jgi:hypothetical protein